MNRLSTQQLKCEMDCTDYPDKYNIFELGYCGHPNYPHIKIFLNQTSNLIPSHFKEEDNFFIYWYTHNQEKVNWFRFIKFTNPRPTHPEQKIRMMMNRLINLVLDMEVNPLVFIVIWYQLLYFSIQKHLKACWLIMQLQKWVPLIIIRMLLHTAKVWGEMVLLHFFCTLPNV